MSAVNQPHPDAVPDDATDFFGGAEEEVTPDPGTFDPETGDFAKPTEPVDGRTPEQRREDAYQYASGHGEPITDAMEQAHQEFIGVQEKVEPAAPELSEPEVQQAKLRAIAQREAAEKEAAAAVEALPPAEAVPPTEAATTPSPSTSSTDGDQSSPEPVAPAPESGAKKSSGELAREYVVFQRVPLSAKVLKHLLAQIEAGQAPEPRVAWIEVHRAEGRNANAAIAAAYTAHKEELGEKVDMAAVSSRAFQTRHVEPKQVVETNLSIT